MQLCKLRGDFLFGKHSQFGDGLLGSDVRFFKFFVQPDFN